MASSVETVQTNPAIGERGKIDVFLPDSQTTPRPTPFVLAIHGGGWINGDRTSFHWVADRLLPHGFAVITCSYRTIHEACFPAAYDDLVTLLKWLRRHAVEHGLSSSRCALLGSSAGGHLVSLLATRATQEHREEIIPIQGVVCYCPPIDPVLQHEWDLQRDSTMTARFMGGTPSQFPDAYRAASPQHHVHRAMPPMWLAHGDQDELVPMSQSQGFVERLASVGIEHSFHIAPGRGHTMLQVDKVDQTNYELLEEMQVVTFLKRCLCETPGAE